MQLNTNFTFSDLKAALPYLSQLGISHIYASPIFQAKKGSLHGYDVTDPNIISEELGGKAGFEDLMKEVSAYGLDWLQDIVPNHASYSLENQRICDVLAKGADSEYACLFDIDFGYPSAKLYGKLLAPFLSNPYMRCLKQGQITLTHNDEFKIKIGNLEFPINAPTAQHLELNGPVQQTLEKFNSDPRFLNALLAQTILPPCPLESCTQTHQLPPLFRHYRPHRRPYGKPCGFRMGSRLIFELVASGAFSGLRVDHIDGLYKPEEYLRKLRERCPDTYMVVEKILTDKEQLPDGWPVEGTTGYDFINYVNKLFVKKLRSTRNRCPLQELHGQHASFQRPLI